jgi:hypothetical protein
MVVMKPHGLPVPVVNELAAGGAVIELHFFERF